VVETLQDIQMECGYLPEEAICHVSEALKVPLIDVFRLAAVYRVPSRRLAEELGRSLVQNIVMVGFITATSGVVSLEAARKSVRDCVPEGTVDINLKAFDTGYQYAQEQ
jgi:Pyruvate/2-oxoacid:ferredoxin oxidoreductase gamma subunit